MTDGDELEDEDEVMSEGSSYASDTDDMFSDAESVWRDENDEIVEEDGVMDEGADWLTDEDDEIDDEEGKEREELATTDISMLGPDAKEQAVMEDQAVDQTGTQGKISTIPPTVASAGLILPYPGPHHGDVGSFSYSSMFPKGTDSEGDVHSMPEGFSILEGMAPRDHHFSGQNTTADGQRLRRIQKEHKILRSSLPDGVYVRTWESSLDLIRVLMLGPLGTPYEHAPFLFDLHLDSSFPFEPPKAFFHSWTDGTEPANPNLYTNGKICLSLLGTWPGDERNETWSSKSTILQIIVSILGLVLVKEPYFSKFLLPVPPSPFSFLAPIYIKAVQNSYSRKYRRGRLRGSRRLGRVGDCIGHVLGAHLLQLARLHRARPEAPHRRVRARGQGNLPGAAPGLPATARPRHMRGH